MVVVSVSVYNDAALLQGCLKSLRDALGNVRIQVVDGKYETFKPDAEPNSTDDTPAVCDAYGAEYWPDGPFELERDKHVHRVERLPEGELALFIDADERLLEWDADRLPDETAVSPRIFNPLVYGPHAVYWPRIFKKEWVKTVNRWDAYLFDAPHERSDAVTIIHRHDLRDRNYREAKYARFDREGRTGRYESNFETYLNDEWDAAFETCPECGAESVTRSQVTDLGPSMSQVKACVNGDRCHAAIESTGCDEWRYLPTDVDRGVEEDPQRLRMELLDAGCEFVRLANVEYMVGQMLPAIRIWVREELGEAEREVFA